MQTLCLLGSTGSIGTQVLDVVRQFPDRFQVHSLAAGRNLERLAEQVAEFSPASVVIQDEKELETFRALLSQKQIALPEIHAGEKALAALPDDAAVQTVIVGLVGLAGLAPTLTALQSGKKVLTANKETLVAGGHLVQPYLSQMLPIDSEHSAIHQCLAGINNNREISRLLLTASGGPFRTWPKEKIEQATLEDALRHPNWVMGRKITIDSASLMNKGLEVIEAHWLFGVAYDQIDVLVHPQSTVHSGVELVDGSLLFQLGATDMRGPIQYAMFHPERVSTPFENCRMDLATLSRLDFEPPDYERFPCLKLAYEAGRLGGSATCVLNAADEAAVALVLESKIRFQEISPLITQCLEAHQAEGIVKTPTLTEIQQVDAWARTFVNQRAIQLLTR